MTTWDFYLTDPDRATGPNNHGEVLQYVTRGDGDTP